MSRHISRYLVRFGISMVILYGVLALVVAGGRATLVYLVHEETVPPTPVLKRLAAQWSRDYPALQSPDNPPIAAPVLLVDHLIAPAQLLINPILDRIGPSTGSPPVPPASSEPARPEAPTVSEAPAVPEARPQAPAEAVERPAARRATSTPDPGNEDIPSPEPVGDPSLRWAVVIANRSPVFDQTGQRRGHVSAGAVMNVQETRRSRQGDELLFGEIHAPEGRLREVLINRNRTEVIPGKRLSDTSREERQQQSDRGRLLGKIADRTQEIELALKNRNPHYREYREVLTRLKALQEEARTLNTQYEEATGADRIEAANRLREIKNKQATLMSDHTRLKAQRDQWDQQNPQTSNALEQAIARDQNLAELKSQLQAIP